MVAGPDLREPAVERLVAELQALPPGSLVPRDWILGRLADHPPTPGAPHVGHRPLELLPRGDRVPIDLRQGPVEVLVLLREPLDIAEELAGDAVLGNTSYQNYDHHVAFGPGGINWYEDEMIKWAEYFGDLGSNNQATNAPELCTVYGNIQLTTIPCDVSAFYGASWIFQRYIGDQFGPSYPGGLVQLTRDWVMKNPSLVGSANIAALLGVNYDTLFAHFATALALDDRNNGTGTAWVPTVFSITSWNSDSIATWISTCCQFGWLNPPAISFGTTSASRSVRGGSTAYTILSASGPHPAAAIALTDASRNPLSTGLRPTMWVVRIQ